MRQSEPPMPKIDKAKVPIPGTEGGVAVMVDTVAAIKPAKSIRNTPSQSVKSTRDLHRFRLRGLVRPERCAYHFVKRAAWCPRV